MDFASRKIQCGGKLILLRLPDGTHLQLTSLSYKDFLVCRALYQSETVDTYVVDDLVAKLVVQDECFFNNSWLDAQRAGISHTIAQLAMFLASNHFEEPNILYDMLHTARNDAHTLDNTMFSIICRVYPGYKFSDLEQLNYPEIVRLFACAEKALLETGMLEKPIEIQQGGSDTSSNQPQQNVPKGSMVISDEMVAASEAQWGHIDNMADIYRHEKDAVPPTPPRPGGPPKASKNDIRKAVSEYNGNVARPQTRVKKKLPKPIGKF